MYQPHNDEEFKQWFETNHGYVVNTYLGANHTPIPHRIHDPEKCGHFKVKGQWRKNMTKEYAKFCFTTSEELEQWLLRNPARGMGYPKVLYADCTK